MLGLGGPFRSGVTIEILPPFSNDVPRRRVALRAGHPLRIAIRIRDVAHDPYRSIVKAISLHVDAPHGEARAVHVRERVFHLGASPSGQRLSMTFDGHDRHGHLVPPAVYSVNAVVSVMPVCSFGGEFQTGTDIGSIEVPRS